MIRDLVASRFIACLSVMTVLVGWSIVPICSDAQAVEVTGTVVNKSGSPVSGANVVLPGTLYAAVSDESGSFVLRSVRQGSYRIRVIHPDYLEYDSEIQVDGPFRLSIELASADADLRLSQLDKAHEIAANWSRPLERRGTRQALAHGRIVGVPAYHRTFDTSAPNSLGVVVLGPGRAVYPTSVQPEMLTGFGTLGTPTVINPLRSFSTRPVVEQLRSDEIDEGRSSVGLGFDTNGGGPVGLATLRSANSDPAFEAVIGFKRFLTDYKSQDVDSFHADGSRFAMASRVEHRLSSNAVVTAGGSLSYASGVPYPIINYHMDRGLDIRTEVGVRQKGIGAVEFVDANASYRRQSVEWNRMLANGRESDDSMTVDSDHFQVDTRVGLSESFSVMMSGELQSVAGEDQGSDREIQTGAARTVFPDLKKGAVGFGANFGRQNGSLLLVTQGFVTLSRHSAEPESGEDPSDRFLEGRISSGLQHSFGDRSTISVLGSYSVTAPPLLLYRADGVLVNLGQQVVRVPSSQSTTMRSSAATIGLSHRLKAIDLNITGTATKGADSVTLLRDTTSSVGMSIGITDVIHGDVFASASSNLRDFIYVGVDTQLYFGRNTEFDETIAALPQSNVGGSLTVTVPSGSSYLRFDMHRYFSRDKVADRLIEQRTRGAFVADVSVGVSRFGYRLELYLMNVFNKSFAYHDWGIGSGVRVPARGRSLGIYLTR